jgi:DNA topoisomerase-3
MSFIKVLMVAEKPSIADALARSLSGGRSIKGDSRIPVHEYRGNFLGQDAVFFVTSVMGHVFRCAALVFFF